MTRTARLCGGGLLAVLVMAAPSRADQVTLDFVNITSNGSTNVAGQLSVVVSDAQLSGGLTVGANQVVFRFQNAGPAASSITDVYFDDGTLLGISALQGSSGVSFSQGASPPNLPGGGTLSPPFETTQGFLADSNTPVAVNGVNPGEWLDVRFNLINGQNYSDTVGALDSGLLRIGMHVQAIGNGYSDSFVNGPPDGPAPSVVPVPPTLQLAGMALLTGLAGFGWRRRRRAN
jgi:hypothetical protein